MFAGPAINQFEVKDLDSSPGAFEFQSQNAFSTGQPRRRAMQSGSGDVIYDDNTVIRQREALEIQMGVTEWFRIRLGIEYEQERLDDPASFGQANAFGSLKLDEVAVEAVIVFVKPKEEGVGLGLLIEYGAPVGNEPGAQSELYLGPIIQASTGPWSVIANLAFLKHLGGGPEVGETDFVRDDKWDFSYFVQGSYAFSKSWSLALEAYGTLDRIDGTGYRSEAVEAFGESDQHRAGPVLYYTILTGRPTAMAASGDKRAGDHDDDQVTVSLGGGALFGLNEHTPDTTYKLSLEVEF